MAGVIAVDFRIGHVQDVLSAVRTISQAAVKGARAQLTEVQKASKEEAAAKKSAARDAAAFQRELDKVGANAFKAKLKEQTAATKAALKEESAAKKAAAKEEAAFQRELDRASKQNAFDRIRSAAKAQADAAKTAASASNRNRAAVGEIGSGAARGFRSGVGMLASVGAMATGGLGVATVADAVKKQMGLGERVALVENSSGKSKNAKDSKDQFDFLRTSKDVSNAVGVDASDVMGGFEKIAGKAGGAGIDAVKNNMLDLAKVARGAGVSMADMGDVVGTLVNRGVKAEDMVGVIESLVKQGKDGAVEFKDLATMLDESSGALGRFKMGDNERVTMAGGLSQLARTYGKKSAAEATGSVNDLARDLGGKADIIQKLTGGEATTVHVKGKKTKEMVNGKMVETTTGDSTKTVYAGGVEVGTDDTRAQLRSMGDLLPEILMGAISKGNAGKITGEGGIFTGNSVAIVAPLIQAATTGIVKNAQGRYDLAKEGQTAEVSGEAAIRAMLKQASAGDVGATDSKDAFDRVMATDAAKFSQAMNKLSNDLGDRLAPAIANATPQIVSLADTFGSAVIKIAENPKTAIAGFLAFSTALGAAESAVGVFAGRMGEKLLDRWFGKAVPLMDVKAGVVNVTGGAPPPPPPPGTPPAGAAGGASKLVKAGGALIAGAAGAYEGWQIGTESGAALDKNEADVRKTAAEGSNLATRIRMGDPTLTQGDREEAQAKLGQLEGRSGAGGRFIEGAMRGAKGLAKGDFTASNVVSTMLPPAVLGRGLMESAAGGQGDKDAAAAIADLKAALALPTTLAAGQTLNVVVTNASEIGAKTGNAQEPKAQGI